MEKNVFGSKKLSRSLLFFSVLLSAVLITVWARAEQVILAWDANTETDLAGYKINYGTASGSYTTRVDVHNVTTFTVTGLSAGQTYYFAASAYDTSGNESGYSNEVNHTIPAANRTPAKPLTPSGPSTALVNTAIAFTTFATDPDGHSLEYHYDWSGGVPSGWGAAGQSHSWSAAGQYIVKVQARDSLGALSDWSDGKTVTISSPVPLVVDSDRDGFPDSQDAFPYDPQEWADTNGNRIGDNADAAAAAQGPEAPVLISPAGKEVSTLVVLETDTFDTEVAGTTHSKTRWQVYRKDDAACVLDILSTTALTSLPVPKLVLDEYTEYYWRAQFIDTKGTASPWSDDLYFETPETGADLNTNGIPDVQDVGPATDLDKDGVKDYQQPTIKSVKMEGKTVQIGVSIKDCPTAIAVESVESEDPQQSGAYASEKPLRMPFGLINFKIAVLNPGDQAVVKLYFSEPAPAKGRWYKYDSISDSWYDFSAYARFAANRRSLTLTLRDGGPGDADGVANGVIVDPAGIVEEADAETISSDVGAGGGEGGGCFIAAANAGVAAGNDMYGWWLMLGLMSVTWPLLCKCQKLFGIWG